jgi:hypothetical protein
MDDRDLDTNDAFPFDNRVDSQANRSGDDTFNTPSLQDRSTYRARGQNQFGNSIQNQDRTDTMTGRYSNFGRDMSRQPVDNRFDGRATDVRGGTASRGNDSYSNRYTSDTSTRLDTGRVSGVGRGLDIGPAPASAEYGSASRSTGYRGLDRASERLRANQQRFEDRTGRANLGLDTAIERTTRNRDRFDQRVNQQFNDQRSDRFDNRFNGRMIDEFNGRYDDRYNDRANDRFDSRFRNSDNMDAIR